MVQKYVHDIKAWRSLPAEQQEAIIGRTKLDNVELDDADEGKQQSHKSLATIEDENGDEPFMRHVEIEPSPRSASTFFVFLRFLSTVPV